MTREYQGYIAEVPSLPDCVSQGKTMDEAHRQADPYGIEGYLYVQEKHGQNKPIPELQMFLGELVV